MERSRLAILRIDMCLLTHVLAKRTYVATMPTLQKPKVTKVSWSDIEILGVHEDLTRNCVLIKMRSTHFAPVFQGEEIPCVLLYTEDSRGYQEEAKYECQSSQQ